jgi:hypothetical protein
MMEEANEEGGYLDAFGAHFEPLSSLAEPIMGKIGYTNAGRCRHDGSSFRFHRITARSTARSFTLSLAPVLRPPHIDRA